MSKQTMLSAKIAAQIAIFQRTADEMKLLNNVSKDLRTFKKLMKVKKFD